MGSGLQERRLLKLGGLKPGYVPGHLNKDTTKPWLVEQLNQRPMIKHSDGRMPYLICYIPKIGAVLTKKPPHPPKPIPGVYA